MLDLKKSFFGLFSATLVSLTVWLAILISTNPFTTDVITRVTFFASLFLWFSGITSFIIIYLSSIITTKTPLQILQLSIIQSLIISAAVVSILILTALKVLGIWEAIIILVISLLAEIMLITQKSDYEKKSY